MREVRSASSSLLSIRRYSGSEANPLFWNILRASLCGSRFCGSQFISRTCKVMPLKILREVSKKIVARDITPRTADSSVAIAFAPAALGMTNLAVLRVNPGESVARSRARAADRSVRPTQSQREVGLLVQPAVFVADDEVVGPGRSGDQKEAQAGGVLGDVEFELRCVGVGGRERREQRRAVD